MNGTYHIVCRTCATEGVEGGHEAIFDHATKPDAKGYANLHRSEFPDHDVRMVEVS